jgi:hypothetical protein
MTLIIRLSLSLEAPHAKEHPNLDSKDDQAHRRRGQRHKGSTVEQTFKCSNEKPELDCKEHKTKEKQSGKNDPMLCMPGLLPSSHASPPRVMPTA